MSAGFGADDIVDESDEFVDGAFDEGGEVHVDGGESDVEGGAEHGIVEADEGEVFGDPDFEAVRGADDSCRHEVVHDDEGSWPVFRTEYFFGGTGGGVVSEG